MTNDTDLQPAVAAEFQALAGLLDSATDAQWDTPSLCAGWRVREVIAHMTMAARYSEEEFMAELRRCDFDFGRLSNEIAARDAALPASELVASLRAEVMQHWTPPGGGWHGALNHVVIHGLDVTVPLGVPRRSPDATIRVVLDDLTGGGVHDRFGTSIQGRSLQATDLDWSYGSGPALRGPAEDLALVLCGRAVPTGRLEGEAAVSRRSPAGPILAGHPLSTAADRRSMSQPAAAVAVVAAAPSKLTGTPATRATGCGGSSTAVPGTSGARKNGAQ